MAQANSDQIKLNWLTKEDAPPCMAKASASTCVGETIVYRKIPQYEPMPTVAERWVCAFCCVVIIQIIRAYWREWWRWRKEFGVDDR